MTDEKKTAKPKKKFQMPENGDSIAVEAAPIPVEAKPHNGKGGQYVEIGGGLKVPAS